MMISYFLLPSIYINSISNVRKSCLFTHSVTNLSIYLFDYTYQYGLVDTCFTFWVKTHTIIVFCLRVLVWVISKSFTLAPVFFWSACLVFSFLSGTQDKVLSHFVFFLPQFWREPFLQGGLGSFHWRIVFGSGHCVYSVFKMSLLLHSLQETERGHMEYTNPCILTYLYSLWIYLYVF